MLPVLNWLTATYRTRIRMAESLFSDFKGLMTEYKNNEYSKDWCIFFDAQVNNTMMHNAFWANGIDFLIWTKLRGDNNTLCWVQTKTRRARSTIERWFPRANWVGTTQGKEEYDAWFHAEPQDRFNWCGEYQVRHATGVKAGREIMEEILAATAAFAEMDDEEEPGELVRANAQFF